MIPKQEYLMKTFISSA